MSYTVESYHCTPTARNLTPAAASPSDRGPVGGV